MLGCLGAYVADEEGAWAVAGCGICLPRRPYVCVHAIVRLLVRWICPSGAFLTFLCSLASILSRAEMFSTAQKTQELWMWKMEYLHHEQRPLYFGEWF